MGLRIDEIVGFAQPCKPLVRQVPPCLRHTEGDAGPLAPQAAEQPRERSDPLRRIVGPGRYRKGLNGAATHVEVGGPKHGTEALDVSADMRALYGPFLKVLLHGLSPMGSRPHTLAHSLVSCRKRSTPLRIAGVST